MYQDNGTMAAGQSGFVLGGFKAVSNYFGLCDED